MDFGIQVLLSVGIATAIGLPIALYKFEKYRKEGRSIKYLALKVSLSIGLPIVAVPFLLSPKLSISEKIIIVIAMCIAGIAYSYGIRYSRKSFRNIMGLSPEDEHTGEVIIEEKKK